MIFSAGEQATLAEQVSFDGIGLHSGEPCSLTIHGADPDTGIVFIKDKVRFQAIPSNVMDTSRGTTLGANGVSVLCVEHLLATFAGLGIDNAVCEVSGPETPAMDGSALPFVRGILKVGVRRQGRRRRQFEVTQPECIVKGQSFLSVVPAACFEFNYLLQYDHPLMGLMFGRFSGSSEEFAKQIAPARTFGLASEADALRSAGLAKGASEDNVVVVYDKEIRPNLRFEDEFVRHKILDMMGDLALAGGAISGTVFGAATGHWANVAMARRLRKD